MGESLGQWKARPNSSNWDTLPKTLELGGRDLSSVGFTGHSGTSRLIPVPSCPSDPMQTQGGDCPARQTSLPVVLRRVLVCQHLQVDGL